MARLPGTGGAPLALLAALGGGLALAGLGGKAIGRRKFLGGLFGLAAIGAAPALGQQTQTTNDEERSAR